MTADAAFCTDHDIFSDHCSKFDQAVGSDRGARMDTLLKRLVGCKALREFVEVTEWIFGE